MSSLLPHLSHTSSTTPSFTSDRINLIDNTRSPEEQSPTRADQNDGAEETIQLSPTKTSSPTISRRITGGSLRENIARRKYAKYSEERYMPESIVERPGPGQRSHTLDSKASATAKGKGRADVDSDNEDLTTPPQTPGIIGSPVKKTPTMESKQSKLQRGQRRVKRFMHWHRTKYKLSEGDIAIDILYENQRGTFIFGSPLFSSQSLLNFDPPAWTNAFGAASPVDITNAQVPDPTWAWDWSTWFVEMSADVDDQGWQYSFSFAKRFSWHGTHPWFHSFVRRRRWIRRRVRRHHHLPDGRIVDAATHMTVKTAHKMTEDYFTIHPSSRAGATSPDSRSYRSGTLSRPITPTIPVSEVDDIIDNIQDLMNRVRRATVDREKIRLVFKFMEEGGEDVHYLADELPHILSLFIFQYTRRQLLTGMLKRLDQAEGLRPQTADDEDHEGGERPSISALRKAVEAADAEIQQLEYWSDIKDIVQKGETLGGVDGEYGWEPEQWPGIDVAGPPHPEHEVPTSSEKEMEKEEDEEAKRS